MMASLKLAMGSRRVHHQLKSHSHPFFELGMVIQGTCQWILDDSRAMTLNEGDFTLIPPDQMHREEPHPRKPVSVSWIGFDIEAPLFKKSFCNRKQSHPQLQTPIRDVMHLIYLEHLQQDACSGELCELALRQLLLYLQRAQSRTPLRPIVNRHQSIAQSAARYLDSNFQKPLSISQVAGYHSLSTPYFTSLFRKEYLVPPQEYLHQRRIKRARELLLQTSLSMKEIAAECGYVDAAHFCRRFKSEQGITPRAFRLGIQ